MRSHRLLRLVHKLRKQRFAVARNVEAYEAFEECRAFDDPMMQIEGDGHTDVATVHGAVLAVARRVFSSMSADLDRGGAAEKVGVLMTRAAFVARSRSQGRIRAGGSDRYVVEGCAALTQAALLDRMFRATAEVMRRRALVDHRKAPCWPQAYVDRRAAEAAAAEAAGVLQPVRAGDGC